MKFKTSSGIKSIVGRDLITDRYIAIFELVKNSYDARATEVIVSFNTSEDSDKGIGSLQKGKIYIVDNGKGMSKDDLENKWLFLAYSDKKEGEQHSNIEQNGPEDRLRSFKNRIYVGSKGIGRFSSDSLGAIIKISTKIASENIEHQLTVNWDDFELSLENKFESIDVKYESTNILSRKDSPSYTILEISNLRENWGNDEIDKVVNKLKRLKNPFVNEDDLEIYCGVNIFEYNLYKKPNRGFIISNNIADVLKEKSINISAYIENGTAKISLIDRGDIIYQIEREEKSLLRNIDKLNISINYLTTSAKSAFTKRMGVAPVNYGNIFIYLNNFHVSPYGDEFSDIFGLNIRKGQGYKRYIGTRELIGFISIYDSKKYFKEASSRNNGFIENGYFKTLEDFYLKYIHRSLERYVQLIKWGEFRDSDDNMPASEIFLRDIENNNEKENFKRYILKDDFNEIYFSEELDFERNKIEKVIDRIVDNSIRGFFKNENDINSDVKKLNQQFKELKEENVAVKIEIKKNKENLHFLRRQNELLQNKRDDTSYGEQITHHINILAERLNFALEGLVSIKNQILNKDKKIFYQALDDILSTKIEMEVFRNLLLRSNLDLKSPKNFNWFEISDWYFSKGRQSYYKNFNINCFASSRNISKWIRTSKYIDVIMMFENFYRNAYEHNASYLEFDFSESELVISNNSEPIKEEYIDSIFELGFSTKHNGTGIGLHQIKQTLKDLGLNIHVKNEDGLVKFIIN